MAKAPATLPKAGIREGRLAAALRENLQRRKTQVRGRKSRHAGANQPGNEGKNS